MYIMARNKKECLKIWQWNCRGFTKKRSVLTQYIKEHSKQKPDVIILQETLCHAKLAGYTTHQQQTDGKGWNILTTTLVRKGLVAVQHETRVTDISHILIEIIPRNKQESSTYVLNVYSKPSKEGRTHNFDELINSTIDIAGRNRLVIGGDFNAPHQQWGYPYSTRKGRDLVQVIEHSDLMTLNELSSHTRIGVGLNRDTTPDLTLCKNIRHIKWENTFEDLGSDHRILNISIGNALLSPTQVHTKLVDWDKFRKNRNDKEQEPITNIEHWNQELLEDVGKATTDVELGGWEEDEQPRVDSRLAHLKQAKRSIQLRLQGQKHNRNLRRKITELNKQIEEHCARLCNQEWDEVCDTLDNNINTSKTWTIFRRLLDPTNTKVASRADMTRIKHKYKGNMKAMGEDIVQTYLDRPPSINHKEYGGSPNEDLDRDFSEQEIRAVLQNLKTKSSPGPDRISNKILRNLDDQAIKHLTDYINNCWKNGKIPDEWKKSNVILIPKPGKPPDIQNMRPISLTSCVGKVMEHACLNRINGHLEASNVYPSSIIGFRPGLSTHDAMIQIKEQLIEVPGWGVRAILGLDLKKAFDRVRHSTILERVTQLNLGQRTYNYIKDFLTDRKATIKLDEEESMQVDMGGAGTPQGSVISPMLFNLVMIGLPEMLNKIEGINHTIYADDITIWTIENTNAGQMEARLQEAVEAVESYLTDTGLECSPEKSELLLYRPRKMGRPPKGTSEFQVNGITLTSKCGRTIPIVQRIRVLGLWLEAKGTNNEVMTRLNCKVMAAIRLIRRVTNRRRGIKERNVVRMVQAFAISHITYVAAFIRWNRAEKDKIDALIRKAYKAALGLPSYTNNERLLQLGVHNTLEEIIEAQRIAQLERLSSTWAGREIMEKLKINYHGMRGPKEMLHPDVRAKIVTATLPKNMHPIYNVERRKCRTKAILKTHGTSENALFVDAARYPRQKAFAAVAIDTKGEPASACSIKARHSEAAEEVAIALAILSRGYNRIISDSKPAIRNYTRGWISREAARILNSKAADFKNGAITPKYLKWIPAHMGENEEEPDCPPNWNEKAHLAARELTIRGWEHPSLNSGGADIAQNDKDRMLTFHDILTHYKKQREVHPPPHEKLDRSQEVDWRRLQTRTYQNPVHLNRIYPKQFPDPGCSLCKHEYADIEHILWKCAHITNILAHHNPDLLEERWRDALASSELQDQVWAIQQARETAERLNLTASTRVA